MPIYEYQCDQCGKLEEVIQKFSDKPLKKCRHCSGKLQKLISHSAFHLKGTGWYVTDYAGKSPKDNKNKSEPANDTSADSKKTKSASKNANKNTE